MRHHTRSMQHRTTALGLALATAAVLVVGCSTAGDAVDKAGDAVGDTMLGMAEGSWTCTSGDDETISLTVGNGSFEVSAEDDDGESETEDGSWKVVEQDIQVSLGDTVGRVIDGKSIGVDAGSLTLEVPSLDRDAKEGETELQTFDVVVEGKDTVEIEPTGETEERYPSGSITCTRD